MFTHRPLPEEPSRWVHVDCRDRLAVLEPGIADHVLGSAEGKWECALHVPGLWKTLAQQELQIQLEAAIVKVYHLNRLEWQRSGDWNFPTLTRATFEILAQDAAPSTRHSVYNVGPDGKVSEPTDEPALRSAARSGRTEIVSLLLENHADVHAKDDQALRWAAQNGHIETLRMLLKHGADFHAMDELALIWSTENGHIETVNVLLEHGADFRARRNSALKIAAREGYIEIVTLFLNRVDNVPDACTMALPGAVYNGHIETVKVLLERGADFRAQGNNALEWAALKGFIDVISLFLDHCDDVPAACAAALPRAADGSSTETVAYLLSRGADVHLRTGNLGGAAPINAAYHGHTETLKLLLEHGADVHAKDDQALSLAATHGHTETVKLLLEHGADVHAQVDNALRAAAGRGHTETVKLLLKNGADVFANDSQALKWALKKGHTKTSALLRAHVPAEPEMPNERMPSLRELARAITGGNLALVQDYLQRGGDPDANEGGTTLLMEATNFKQLEVARALVKGGADVKRINQDGLSALSFALQYPPGQPLTMVVGGSLNKRSLPEVAARGAQVIQALIELLVEGEAEVSPKLKERYTSTEQLMFKTPLMFAVKQGHLEVIRHLLALGADVNGTDYWGKTALQEALSIYQLEIAEMLLDFGAETQTDHWDFLSKAVDYSGNEIGSFLYKAEKTEKKPDAAALANMQVRWCRILARLVAAGADLEHTDKRGYTALFSAVNAGDPVLLSKLIDMGANLEHCVDGATALHYLAGLARLEEPSLVAMVASFAGTGADFDARNGENRTAIEIAAARGYVDLESALKTASTGGHA